MGTLKQKALARGIAEAFESKEIPTAKELIVSSGYAVKSAEASPHVLMNQKGLHEELENYGFTTENAKKTVARIMLKGKEENRLRASDMVFKVHGDYAPEKRLNVNISAKTSEMTDDELMALAYKPIVEKIEQKEQNDKPEELTSKPQNGDTSTTKDGTNTLKR